jgi:hypothetical protein
MIGTVYLDMDHLPDRLGIRNVIGIIEDGELKLANFVYEGLARKSGKVFYVFRRKFGSIHG